MLHCQSRDGQDRGQLGPFQTVTLLAGNIHADGEARLLLCRDDLYRAPGKQIPAWLFVTVLAYAGPEGEEPDARPRP